MMSLEKLNKLTNMQQKALHEAVGKFFGEHCKELIKAELATEEQLSTYIENTKKYCPTHNQELNSILCTVMEASDQKNGATMCVKLKEHVYLYYQQMKNLDASLKQIEDLNKSDVNIAEFDHLDSVKACIVHEDTKLYIDYSLPMTGESWTMLQELTALHFTICGKQYVSDIKEFYIKSNREIEERDFKGRFLITSFCANSFRNKGKGFYRYMMPIDSIGWNGDICCNTAFIKYGWILGLIKLEHEDTIIHVYPCKCGKQNYMVIESLTETEEVRMRDYVYSVALTIGFITGKIHLGECYVFKSATPEYDGEMLMAYHTMRPSAESNVRIFTTNMYYVNNILDRNNVPKEDRQPLYDEQGNFQSHLQDWLHQDMVQQLFNLIHTNSDIARAVVTLIESSNFPLEYQASVRAIVLETLAHNQSGQSLITDEEVWKKIKSELLSVVDSYGQSDEKKISAEEFEILKQKINNLNTPPNAKLLALSLTEVGYSLTTDDKESLKMRNLFLHGKLVKGDVEKQSDKLFYCSLLLHKLCSIIILKRAGFEGYILNNPVLYCQDLMKSKEPALLKI